MPSAKIIFTGGRGAAPLTWQCTGLMKPTAAASHEIKTYAPVTDPFQAGRQSEFKRARNLFFSKGLDLGVWTQDGAKSAGPAGTVAFVIALRTK